MSDGLSFIEKCLEYLIPGEHVRNLKWSNALFSFTKFEGRTFASFICFVQKFLNNYVQWRIL